MARISRVRFPELFIGFVSPIGADIKPAVKSFKAYFEANGYQVIEIKVTHMFRVFNNYIKPKKI